MQPPNPDERVVTLLPMPEALKNTDIAIRTDNHWSTAVNYIYNHTLERVENLIYVIGFSVIFDRPIETAAIKYQSQYYSPMLDDDTKLPFRIAFEMDALAMFDFYERYQRAPVYEDIADGLLTHDWSI